jgi:hypothetical protein
LWSIDDDHKRIGNGKSYFVKRYLVSLFFFNFRELKALCTCICCLMY